MGQDRQPLYEESFLLIRAESEEAEELRAIVGEGAG